MYYRRQRRCKLNHGDGPEARTITEIQLRRLLRVTTFELQAFEVSGLGITVTHSGQKVIHLRNRQHYMRFQGMRITREPHPP